MKLCFPVAKNLGLDSKIHNHFGSAPGFLVVEVESGQMQAVDNNSNERQHGACNPAQTIAGLAPDGVVTGGIGRGALVSLNNAGFKVFHAQGNTIRENLTAARAGELNEFSPDAICGGGHGQGSGHGDHHNHSHAGGCSH